MLDQSHWLVILLGFWCIQGWSIFLSFILCPICLLSVHRTDKIEGSEFSSISGKYCTCCNFIVLITFMPFFHSHASIFCNIKSIDCDMYLVFFYLKSWGILLWSEEVWAFWRVWLSLILIIFAHLLNRLAGRVTDLTAVVCFLEAWPACIAGRSCNMWPCRCGGPCTWSWWPSVAWWPAFQCVPVCGRRWGSQRSGPLC